MQKHFYFLPIALALILAITGCGKTNTTTDISDQPITQNTTPIKIGFIGPMTGDAAHYGENMQVALNIAATEINNTGGINGRPIELLTEDGQCDTKASLNAANKLINISKVPVIIGGVCSAETLATAPLAENSKIVLISPASTNPQITTAGDYIFRLIPSDTFQGKYVASYAYDKLQKRKVAILFNPDKEWSAGVKEEFKKTFLALGGEIVTEEGTNSTSRDIRAQILKIKQANPELIYFPSMVESGIVGIKQMKELELTTPILGGDVWDDAKIPQSLGAIADGVRYTVVSDKTLPPSFVTEMEKTPQGTDINNYSPRGYDALKIIANIMKKVDDDPEKIKDELYKLKNYRGIADDYSLDENGDVINGTYTIKEFRDGKIVEVKE